MEANGYGGLPGVEGVDHLLCFLWKILEVLDDSSEIDRKIYYSSR